MLFLSKLSLLSLAVVALGPSVAFGAIAQVKDARRCGNEGSKPDAASEAVIKQATVKLSAAIAAAGRGASISSSSDLTGNHRAAVTSVMAPKQIKVYFHVRNFADQFPSSVLARALYLHRLRFIAVAGGNLSPRAIAGQIAALNADFRASGFNFTLAGTDFTTNRDYFESAGPGSTQQTAMKNRLYKGGPSDLNLYSVGFVKGAGKGLLGYATLPFSISPNSRTANKDDGVVFLFSSVPGGSTTNYNLGRTVTHETGHWLGLYHTFQGGCTGAGDGVSDTPAEASPAYGCPTGRDSCNSSPGLDPISNLQVHTFLAVPSPRGHFRNRRASPMDYSYDGCMSQFTSGQALRMVAASQQYRKL
ncbi:BZ3500_MvSof-1268-A1-R1_Chr2-3g05356 [Microbotryum saponariae]|uniref:BZ3500_MvSof-1268-A1-R1_Chr2-3g05356 protein n=1 Tax=Microbotryum saponariae TaxID=289078 RepID=A0A2X0K9D7_9BASI|nr:BZ3500_MvSof-1268-A1-R1_Chr2-3g05356 [Microbotryum saponariae]SDA01263.1 BZ3501_MvSof-1269-A2-R1_Chr2-2g05029 [Microbotryum saponariae]